MLTELRTVRVGVELTGLRWAGAAMLGVGAVLPHLPGEVGLPCPLRETTGVPCPLCGMTTSVKAVMRLDPVGAWSANPFGLVLVALAVLLIVRPALRRVSVPVVALGVAVGASWLFQLNRYGWI